MPSDQYYLHIDPSTDAVNSTPGSSYSVDFSNCKVSLPEPIMPRKLTPTVFTCYNSWYPIASNNVLNFTDTTSNARAASVAVASYSAAGTAFATAVQAAMVATGASGSPTCTYSSTTGLFTLGSTANFSIQFSQNTVLASMLGFKPMDLSGTNSYTSTIIPNLTGPNYIMLISQSLGDGKSIFRKRHDGVILRIPVNVSWGSVISYAVDYDATLEFSNGFRTQILDFQLVFPDGTSVNTNGQPWSLTMKIDC